MRTFSPIRRQPRFVIDPDTGRRWPVPQGGADDDGEGGDGSGEGDGESDGEGSGEGGSDGQDDGKKLTQAEVDAIIAKRLKAEQTKWEREAKEREERAKMDEAERLKAEKADADKRADAVTESANRRIVTAEAKVAAVAEGGDPKQAAYIVKLAELDDVEVDDDGNPDSDAIAKAVKKVLDDVPGLKASKPSGRSGGELDGGDPDKKPATMADAVAARYASKGA